MLCCEDDVRVSCKDFVIFIIYNGDVEGLVSGGCTGDLYFLRS